MFPTTPPQFYGTLGILSPRGSTRPIGARTLLTIPYRENKDSRYNFCKLTYLFFPNHKIKAGVNKMANVGPLGASAAKAAGAGCKSTDVADKKPSTHLSRQRDTYPTSTSIDSGCRNYGMSSEGPGNAPYAGFLSREDTNPCVGEGDRMETDDGAEDDCCPSDELVHLTKQDVATYRKARSEIEDVWCAGSESPNAHAWLEITS